MHIRKRGNSYEIIVSDGYDHLGKKKMQSATYSPATDLSEKQIEKELKQFAIEFERNVKSGRFTDGGQTLFAEFSYKWLDDHARANLQPKTLREYERQLEDRIIPAIGHIRLHNLKPTHLISFYKNLQEYGIRNDTKYTAKSALMDIIKNHGRQGFSKLAGINHQTTDNLVNGKRTTAQVKDKICKALNRREADLFKQTESKKKLSGNSVLHYHRLISSILSSAVNWQLIPENVAHRVKPPSKKSSEGKTYDEDDVILVLELLEGEDIRLRTVITLVIYGGMRLGELAGLEWPDINFENYLIRIERAGQYVPGKGIFTKDPKNENSKRTIALPESVIDLLRQYKSWQSEEQLKCGSLWHNSNRLFTQWNGLPIHPETPSNWFKQFRKKYDLPPLTFHQLRHTNASIMISQGVNISTVSKRLGHSSPSTTTAIYAHALKRPDHEAVQMLDSLFNKSKKKNSVVGK